MKAHEKKFFSVILSAMILSSPVLQQAYYSVNFIPEKNIVHADSQNTDTILENVLSEMTKTVTQPDSDAVSCKWSMMCLARGDYYSTDDKFFKDYYDRIVETVNITASSVNMDGALNKLYSTDNSGIILTLTAIGRNPENTGDWNLITPYEDFGWISQQGINGVAFALLALDSFDYQTIDTTIRQQCVDYILEKQLENGGWAYDDEMSTPDITAITLQALSRYTDDERVSESATKAFDYLSGIQLDDGGYEAWGSISAESIAQVITACTAFGINPDTDERFVKNGNSPIDALLGLYDDNLKMFRHSTREDGNPMTTDQSAYALIAYQRFLNGRNSLYDMRDVAQIADTTEKTDISGEDKIIFKAICLYTGDDVDIIPSSEMAVAVAVSGIPDGVALTYSDGNYTEDFLYSQEMSDKAGTSVYIALVSSENDIENFTKAENYSVNEEVSGDTIVFGDVNNDGLINAQDAMDILSSWTKKKNITDEKNILKMNINGDNRINNLDAIGISEKFVSGKDFGIIEKIELLSEENK